MKDYQLRPFSSFRNFIISVAMAGGSAALFSVWSGFPFWGCWGITLTVMLVREWIADRWTTARRRSDTPIP